MRSIEQEEDEQTCAYKHGKDHVHLEIPCLPVIKRARYKDANRQQSRLAAEECRYCYQKEKCIDECKKTGGQSERHFILCKTEGFSGNVGDVIKKRGFLSVGLSIEVRHDEIGIQFLYNLGKITFVGSPEITRLKIEKEKNRAGKTDSQ